jgi:hypothetical protein
VLSLAIFYGCFPTTPATADTPCYTYFYTDRLLLLGRAGLRACNAMQIGCSWPGSEEIGHHSACTGEPSKYLLRSPLRPQNPAEAFHPAVQNCGSGILLGAAFGIPADATPGIAVPRKPSARAKSKILKRDSAPFVVLSIKVVLPIVYRPRPGAVADYLARPRTGAVVCLRPFLLQALPLHPPLRLPSIQPRRRDALICKCLVY